MTVVCFRDEHILVCRVLCNVPPTYVNHNHIFFYEIPLNAVEEKQKYSMQLKGKLKLVAHGKRRWSSLSLVLALLQ